MTLPSPTFLQGLALALFAVAVVHTFSTRYFERLAISGLWIVR